MTLIQLVCVAGAVVEQLIQVIQAFILMMTVFLTLTTLSMIVEVNHSTATGTEITQNIVVNMMMMTLLPMTCAVNAVVELLQSLKR